MAFANKRRLVSVHPIELIDQLAHRHGWTAERNGDEELTLVVSGDWTDYQISIHWRADLEALHIACAFDFKVPEYRQPEIYRLLAQINEQMWVGHFDLWAADGLVMFRHALLLNGADATLAQCEALLTSALESCERYYQAFQFVVWAGKGSREALVTTMFETEGQA
ncbi:MAG: YbjN domain-containing protein [Hyphomicrobiaceae bacterium]